MKKNMINSYILAEWNTHYEYKLESIKYLYKGIDDYPSSRAIKDIDWWGL